MNRPPVALAVVAGVLAATVGLAEAIGTSARAPSRNSAPTTLAPIVGARLVCPDVVTRNVGQIGRVTRIGVGVPDLTLPGPADVKTAAGSVVITQLARLGKSAPPPPIFTARGSGRGWAARSALGDLVVDGTGALAPGLSAEILDRRDGGAYRGLDGVACAAPAGDAWILGGSTTVGQHTEVRLTNVDDQPALVDLTLYGTRGPIRAPAGEGIGVAARSTRVIQLEKLAPAERLILMREQTRYGQVATAVRVQTQQAATPQGVDWLPIAAAPATRNVVTGMLLGRGPRRLVLANPGGTDATASVRLVTTSAFIPRGLSSITVPAGSVTAVDVTKPLAAGAGSLDVTSDQPLVVAGWMSTGHRKNGYAEQAWTAATSALTGPATVVLNLTGSFSNRLYLTAPQATAAVRITTLLGAGPAQPRSFTVRVPAGRTQVVELGRLATGVRVIGVTITPNADSGPVFAARAIVENGTRSQLYSVLPLRTAPETRVLRPAVADLRAGLPGGG